MKIYYLSYYSKSDDRNYSLASVNKVDYIVSALVRNNYEVEIISPSLTQNGKKGKASYTTIDKGVTLKQFGCLSNKNKIFRFIRNISLKYKLLCYIRKKIPKNNTIFIYHSLGICKLYKKIKKLGYKIILEVEEIYNDVLKQKRVNRIKELESLKNADAYIFPTELLNQKINVFCKPYGIVYGSYGIESAFNKIFNDDKIHVVYSGTFDQNKGGVNFAIKTAEFLNEKYHLHILGFGSNDEINKVKKEINEVSLKTKCTVSYDGLKKGEKYKQFLQSCNIGLSTQNPNANFNDTSFPSKVLTYMVNGLFVVSVKIQVLEHSSINDYIYYYDKPIPQEIAKTIMNIDLTKTYDPKKIIKELDKKFIKELNIIIKKEGK